MPYDFPTNPVTGTVVTVPDGSYRVWDSQKWRAAPSAHVVIPPTGFLPLTGGTISPGPLNIVNGNTLTLSTSPTQAQIDYNQPNLVFEASTFVGTVSGTTLTITGSLVGTVNVGHSAYWSGNVTGDIIVGGSGLVWTLANTHSPVSGAMNTNNKESVTQFTAVANVSGSIPVGGITQFPIAGMSLGASSDSLSLPNHGLHFLDVSSLHNTSTFDGSRIAISGGIVVDTACVLTNPLSVFTNLSMVTRGQANVGGIAGRGNGSGWIFGSVIGGTIGANGTYYQQLVGTELDIGVVVGGSVEGIIGFQIVHQFGHGVQGTYADIGFGLGDQQGVTKGWLVGASVGGPNSQWPIDPNGTIWRSSYAPSTPWAIGVPGAQAAVGFDLNQVDFTGMSEVGGGFAFRADGARIIPALGNPGGTFQAGAGEFSGTATGAKIDTTFSQMTGAPAVVAGGSLWNVGDTLNDQWGNHIQVATLSGDAIATVTVLRRGWQKTPPANPVAFSINTTTGRIRAGTGATFNLTWTLNNTLALQPSGGATVFGGPVTLPAGSTGAFLPLTGGVPLTGPLSLVNAGTSGSYDAQVNVVGGGSQAGHGELNYIAAMHHFCTFDGSEQFRVGAAPGGDEVWEARGSVAEAGATLVTAGTATDVDAVFVAKGNGQFHFGNYNSPLLELVAPNEIITNYLQVTARGSGNPVAVTFAGPAGTNVSGFIAAQSTVGGITLANSNGNIATFISAAGTVTDYLVVRPGTATTNITMRALTGSIAIGGSQLLTNATNGFVLIPNMAGVPTGVPDKITGGLPIVYDTSDDRLYAYNGSWKPVNSRKTLYVTGTNVGSGADITEDILQTFTIDANQLANVGDMLRVVASGTYISSTNTKNARLRFGPASGGLVAATAICASSGITAGISNWAIEAWIVKTGVNTQSYSSLNSIGGTSNTGTVSGTIAVTDTAATVIGVTGQNATNSVGSSVACQVFIVEYIPAGA